MKRAWERENPPHWDQKKADLIGKLPAGIFNFGRARLGDLLPGEWWRVEEDGAVVGYGWMDTSWGEGEILLAVAPQARGRGLGGYILDQLEHEARVAGLNYIHNVIRPTHPDGPAVRAWLEAKGFVDSGDGRLKRQIRRG